MNAHSRPIASYTVFISFFLKNFSFYGVMALLISFFIKGALISEKDTITLVSKYIILVNTLIFFGSFIADKYLGIRKTYLLGHIIYTCAFILLSYMSFILSDGLSSYSPIVILFFVAMVMSGTTMNSSNHTLLTKAHQNENKLEILNTSYSYNYFFGNLGAILGKILFPFFIGTSLGLIYGYRLAFCFATGIIFIAVINLLRSRLKLSSAESLEDKVSGYKQKFFVLFYIIFLFLICYSFYRLPSIYLEILAYSVFVMGIFYFVVLAFKQEFKSDKIKIFIAIIICLQMSIFFIYRNQIFLALAIYPLHTMVPINLFGLKLGGEISVSFNAFFAILGVPLVLGILKYLKNKNIHLHIGSFFIIGMFLTLLSYIVFWYSTLYAQSYNFVEISSLWFIIGHSFVAIAEVFIMNLALAQLSLLVPKNLTAQILGLHYIAMGVGAIISNKLAQSVTVEKFTSLETIYKVYNIFFAKLTIIAIISVIIFIIILFIIKFLERKFS